MEFQNYSPAELCRAVGRRAKEARLSREYRQQDLAERAGVPVSTVKRFESTGRVAFEAVVRIAFALGVERDFETLFPPHDARSLDEILAAQRPRRRVRRPR
jgi:transcriptional regulator with XRE-family HTH domain